VHQKLPGEKAVAVDIEAIQPLLPPFSAGGFAKAPRIGKQEGRQEGLM